MKIHVLSDLHLEFAPFEPTPVDSDVVVLAGDIDLADRGIHWAAKRFAGRRVIYVLGNHEFYNGHYQAVVQRCQKTADEHGIIFLEDGEAIIDGVRFLGATLWSDFRLYGRARERITAMETADLFLSDFQCIRYADDDCSDRRFRPADAAERHRHSRYFLEGTLAAPFEGKTVVVTHFLPSRRSIAPKYHGDALNPYFCTNLASTIKEEQPALWIHGHTHDSCDYRIGRTRVICNPRGYVPQEPNPDFDPALVVEI